MDAGTKRRCRQADVKRALAVQPIRGLHEKRVSWVGFEELPEVPRDVAVPYRRLEVVASLTPDQKQRRPGPVLPPHHQVRVEELGVEIARARPRIGLEAGSIGRK